MNIEILLVTLLYAVTLVGFIVAINSRGPVRVALSYFFAILCLCASVFHTARLVTAASGDLFPGMAGGAASGASRAGEIDPATASGNAVILAADTGTETAAGTEVSPVDKAALADARNRLRSLVQTSMRLQGNLSRLVLQNLVDLPEEEFQYLRSVATSSFAEAAKLQNRFKSLKADIPGELNEAATQVERGLDALYSASHNLDRFFRAENNEEERMRRESFLSERQQSAAFFRRALERL